MAINDTFLVYLNSCMQADGGLEDFVDNEVFPVPFKFVGIADEAPSNDTSFNLHLNSCM